MVEYELNESDEFNRRKKQYVKKRRNEAIAMFNNLHSYVGLLQDGLKPMQIKAGWLHVEKNGVFAVDQKGCKGKGTQLRLYLFPDVENKKIHLITIGDKTSQPHDVVNCKNYVNDLRSHDAQNT